MLNELVILVIGDIFGKIGRGVIKDKLADLKIKYKVDLTVANVENATHGRGISPKHYLELKNYGIDIMTSGNHIFDHPETSSFISKTDDLLRPLNSNPYHPGRGTTLFNVRDKKVRVTNLIGTVFMPRSAENPYFALEKVPRNHDIHLVDFHAEATAEKIALGLFFDGQITALWGTHTHVQTADARILAKGTAYITDVGMTGSSQGVVGAEPNCIFERNRKGLPSRIIPCTGNGQINAIIIKIDNANNAVKIERIID